MSTNMDENDLIIDCLHVFEIQFPAISGGDNFSALGNFLAAAEESLKTKQILNGLNQIVHRQKMGYDFHKLKARYSRGRPHLS